jgi:ubiquinone/menaquinone biosynthesis C-methylase UbiE
MGQSNARGNRQLTNTCDWDRIASHRIALKARGGVVRDLEWETEDPEELFAELVSDYAKGASDVLDVGCGEGSTALEIAKLARLVVGVDISQVAVAHAGGKSSESTARFVQADARGLPFADRSFDLVYSRRGPACDSVEVLTEIHRVLKPGAALVALVVGESHRIETQQVFGRGRNWPPVRPVRFDVPDKLESVGLEMIYFTELYGTAYYPNIENYAELLAASQQIPDFDREKDAALLREVARQLTTARGIRDTQHMAVLVATKPE